MNILHLKSHNALCCWTKFLFVLVAQSLFTSYSKIIWGHKESCPAVVCLCRGSDPAARAAVAGFAQGPPDLLAAAYDMTLRQVQLVKGYLQHLTATYLAPAFANNVLGPPLGPHSGGLLVARSVGDWLNGACCCSPTCFPSLGGF